MRWRIKKENKNQYFIEYLTSVYFLWFKSKKKEWKYIGSKDNHHGYIPDYFKSKKKARKWINKHDKNAKIKIIK